MKQKVRWVQAKEKAECKKKKKEEASTMNSSRSKIPSNICIEDNYNHAYFFFSKD